MSKTHDHRAFPHEPEIEAVMRFGSVKRWHMLDTVRVQTLAEHSGNVALLAMVVAYHCPGMYFGPGAVVAAAALVHDLPEVFTGDIPTPTKRYISGLEDLEKNLLGGIVRIDVEDKVKTLIKLCDLADGIRFIRIHGSGAIGRHATEGLIEQFDRWVAKAISEWPPEVLSYVVEKVWFYAHETGVEASQGSEVPDGGPVAPDLARGQGDNAGGTGRQLRDVGPTIINNPSYKEYLSRNRMARTEGERSAEDSDDEPFF